MRRESNALMTNLYTYPGWMNDPFNHETLEEYTPVVLGTRLSQLMKSDGNYLTKVENGEISHQNLKVHARIPGEYKKYYNTYKDLKLTLILAEDGNE
jgi:hypothetical protein